MTTVVGLRCIRCDRYGPHFGCPECRQQVPTVPLDELPEVGRDLASLAPCLRDAFGFAG